MARIFIDVHPDGTFTTGPYHGDLVAHAANQAAGVVTYMTEDVGDIDKFGLRFQHFTRAEGYTYKPSARWSGCWRQWGAFCITRWGGWFERVDGAIRRARLPTADDKADQRITETLAANGELGIGVLKNRLRSLTPTQIFASLSRLQRAGIVVEERFKHPINRVDSARYRLSTVVAEASLTGSAA